MLIWETIKNKGKLFVSVSSTRIGSNLKASPEPLKSKNYHLYTFTKKKVIQ